MISNVSMPDCRGSNALGYCISRPQEGQEGEVVATAGPVRLCCKTEEFPMIDALTRCN